MEDSSIHLLMFFFLVIVLSYLMQKQVKRKKYVRKERDCILFFFVLTLVIAMRIHQAPDLMLLIINDVKMIIKKVKIISFIIGALVYAQIPDLEINR